MPARPKPSRCDAPRCTETVKRGMLMCRAHWFALPKPLREAISLTWKQRRLADWSANCLEARTFLAARETRTAQVRDRMLGEGVDA